MAPSAPGRAKGRGAVSRGARESPGRVMPRDSRGVRAPPWAEAATGSDQGAGDADGAGVGHGPYGWKTADPHRSVRYWGASPNSGYEPMSATTR